MLLLAGVLLSVAPSGAAVRRSSAPSAPQGSAPSAPQGSGAPAFDSIAGHGVTVHHVAGDSLLARSLLARLEAQAPLPALPDSIPWGVRAYLADSRRTFDSLVGGRVPEWSGGVALPREGILIVPAFGGSLTRPGEADRVLRHEWAHLGLQQYLEGLRIPRWFTEGYAEWAGGWDASEAWRLRILIARGKAPPLDSLSFQWPADAASATAAYLLSATALQYLLEASGERGLEIFLRRWRESGSFEDALRQTYGVTSGQLEEDWRGWVKKRYGWLYVVSHSALMWAFLAVLLVVMVVIRRGRNREQMERLREEEVPDRPAYWLGEESFEGEVTPSPPPPERPPEP